MRKLLMSAAAVAALAVVLPAHAASDTECQSMWQKADTNGDGKLSDTEAERYQAAMRVHERTLPAGGTIDRAAFLDACKADTFATKEPDAGAPLKGANSFTEGQAKDRAVSHGYGNVSGLKKDDDGIWRGQAQQDGKPVQIAVDYKGNVVATPQ